MVVWPRKREMAAYILLSSFASKGKAGIVNLGDAIQFLVERLCVSRKTARSIIKRLRNLGLVETIVGEREVFVKIKSLEEGMEYLAKKYAEERNKKAGCIE